MWVLCFQIATGFWCHFIQGVLQKRRSNLHAAAAAAAAVTRARMRASKTIANAEQTTSNRTHQHLLLGSCPNDDSTTPVLLCCAPSHGC
jgi:hypothetical protein